MIELIGTLIWGLVSLGAGASIFLLLGWTVREFADECTNSLVAVAATLVGLVFAFLAGLGAAIGLFSIGL